MLIKLTQTNEPVGPVLINARHVVRVTPEAGGGSRLWLRGPGDISTVCVVDLDLDAVQARIGNNN